MHKEKAAGHTTVCKVRDGLSARRTVHATLLKGGYFMNYRKTLRRLGAAGISLLLITVICVTAAAAIELPRGREALPGSDPAVSDPAVSDPMMSDPLPDDPLMGEDMMGGTENNLGDTEPGTDPWIGEADGFIEDPADSVSTEDTATDTAGTSSGNEEGRGMSVFGIVITVVILLAVAALVIALIPKKKSGT